MAAPKSHPKWGGRAKGTPNKVNVATRERIEREADPIGFLCGVIRGKEVDGSTPTLEQRMNAAKVLAGKVLPDLRSVELDHTQRTSDASVLTDEELIDFVNERSGTRTPEAA